MILEFGLLILSMIFIALSSEKAVKYVSGLSNMLKISGTAAGFIILSVSTSLPELFVAIQSALTNVSNFSVGNVFGANISNITLVIGLAAILSKKEVIFRKKVHDELIKYLFISIIISLFLIIYGKISLFLGILLIILFIFFSIKIPKRADNEILGETEQDKYLILKFVAATAVLIFFSRILVDNAVKIAEELSIPASIVGATIVSIGTTLPELTTTIQAFKKKMFDIGLSNAIGSCIVNSTLILGINTLVGFKAINLISVTSLLIFFLAACILLWYFINTERKIKKIEASVLISAYLVFIIQELGLITFIFK